MGHFRPFFVILGRLGVLFMKFRDFWISAILCDMAEIELQVEECAVQSWKISAFLLTFLPLFRLF